MTDTVGRITQLTECRVSPDITEWQDKQWYCSECDEIHHEGETCAGEGRPLEARIKELEEVRADHHRLVREIDIAINGEDGAAKQASLCDIASQVVAIQRRNSELENALRAIAAAPGGGPGRIIAAIALGTKEET